MLPWGDISGDLKKAHLAKNLWKCFLHIYRSQDILKNMPRYVQREEAEIFLGLIRNQKNCHIRFETVEKYSKTSKQKSERRASRSPCKDPLKQRCSLEWNAIIHVMEMRRVRLLVSITLSILQVTHNSLYDLCAGCRSCLTERMIILLHRDIQQRDTQNHPYSSTYVWYKEHDKLILDVHLTRLERQGN